MARSRRRPDPRREALLGVRALVDALYQSARGVEARTGRTNAQIAVLRQVARHGPISVNDLAERVRTGQSTVSLLLTRLQQARLVRRSRSSEDRRRVLVNVTSAGRALLRRAPRPATEQLLRALDALSTREARAVANALSDLLRALHRGRKRPPMLFEEA
jgi:DNA-binding MarR family transcriptional regulator